ncbi:unnamed protein product, partial [Iphiclides podalirius]
MNEGSKPGQYVILIADRLPKEVPTNTQNKTNYLLVTQIHVPCGNRAHEPYNRANKTKETSKSQNQQGATSSRTLQIFPRMGNVTRHVRGRGVTGANVTTMSRRDAATSHGFAVTPSHPRLVKRFQRS